MVVCETPANGNGPLQSEEVARMKDKGSLPSDQLQGVAIERERRKDDDRAVPTKEARKLDRKLTVFETNEVKVTLTTPTKEKSPNTDGFEVLAKEASKLALFHYDEIVRGERLGSGSFSVVYAVQQFKLIIRENEEKKLSQDELDARRYYTEQLKDGSVDKSRKYAMKCLKDDFDDPKMFRYAAKDMETEASILAKINHHNIVKVYAKSASGSKASECTKENAHDFFIVVDRLSGTLTDKIDQWKRKEESTNGASFFSFAPNSAAGKNKEFFMERLRIANDVASALAYLHENRIIYRDLKADNVGFDYEGKSKLFDFGFARQLPTDPKKKMMNDTYKMSGMTGSLMFMAPEVFYGKPYNEKADVYSFAMLFWQMLSLELPYLGFIYDGRDVFEKKVMQKAKRPSIQSKWPKKIQNDVFKGWSKDMDERPTMQEMRAMVKEVITSLRTSPARKAGPKKFTKRSAYQ